MKKILLLLLTLLFCFSSVLALGVADLILELDGDARSTSRSDWDKVFLNTAGDQVHTFDNDVEGANIFTGTVTDDAPISTWRWTNGANDGVAGNLNIKTGFTSIHNNFIAFNDVITIYFGAVVNSAGAFGAYGFWFYQSAVTPLAGGQFSGTKQDGDLLVLIGTAADNTVNNIQIFRWSTTTGPDASLVQIYSRTGNDARCRTGVEQTACGFMNAVATTSYKNGDPQFAAGTFIEGGVKLNDLYPVEIPCFSSYLIESKDNMSATATSRDFLVGNFPMCGIRASLTCDSVGINAARDGFVFEGTVTVTNPFARLVKNVEIKYLNTTVAVLPRVLPGEVINVDISGTTKEPPGNIGSATVSGQVGGKFPAIVNTNAGSCPPFVPRPSLNLTKTCEVQLAPYKFADDGTKEVKIFIQGTVTNNGNVDLTNVVVNDDDGFTWEYPSIRVGESIFFSRSIKAINSTTQIYRDTVTATGTAVLGLGIAIAAPVTATCPTVNVTGILALSKKCTTVTIPDGDFEVVRVNYEITATNAGNIELRNVTVVDDKGTPTNPADDVTYGPVTLLINESMTFTGFYFPTNPTAGLQSDTVTGSAVTIVHLYPAVIARPITAVCEGIKRKPALALTKNCSTALIDVPGGKAVQLTFTGTVRNTGDTTLRNVIVVDDKGTPTNTADDLTFGPYVLAPGETRVITQSYTPANPTSSRFTDTLSASGEPNIRGFAKITATPVSATCAGIVVNKKIELTKRCAVTSVTNSNGFISFQINVNGTVKNNGDIDLTGVKVYDNDGFTWDIGVLSAGQTKTFTRLYAPSDPTASSFSDTVTANGTAVAGFGTVSASAVTATCKPPKVNPKLKLDKSCVVSLSSPTPAGDRTVMISYEVTVTNEGNVALKEVRVVDDKGTPSVSSDDEVFALFDLAAGESKSLTGIYAAQNPQATSFTDTVTATAKNVYLGFPAVSAPADTATCKNVDIKPKLELDKTCTVSLQNTVGGQQQVVVFYAITVSNTGNVALKNVIIKDDAGSPSDPTDDPTYGPYTINPSSSFVINGSYIADKPTATSQSDTATGSADNTIVGYPSITAKAAKATCEGVKVKPGLVLTKQCAAVTVSETDGTLSVKVQVTGTVANTGDIDLLNVVVTDNIDAFTWTFPILKSGDIKSISRTYIPASVTAPSFTDTITGFAVIPAGLGNVTSSPVTAVCKGISTVPKIVLTKTCRTATEVVTSGSPITRVVVFYSGTVSNTGNGTAINVIVVDDKGTPANLADDATYGPYTLAPRESRDFGGFYYPSQVTAASQSDTVTASGRNIINGFPAPVVVPVTATCVGVKSAPNLALTKQCVTSLETQTDGSKKVLVTYQGTVRNTGDTTLVDVYVTDDKGTPANTADDQSFGPFTLPPGETRNFSGSYYPAVPTQVSYSDTVKASGLNSISGFPGATATPVTATCGGIKYNPKLELTKRCIVTLAPTTDKFLDVVVQVNGLVANAGDIELLNIVVRDDIDGFTWSFDRLAPGESKPFSRSYNPQNPTAASQNDTVTGTAVLPAGLGPVTATPVTASCKGIINVPALTLTKGCYVLTEVIAGGKREVRVHYEGTVKNTGTHDLLNVVVIDDLGTPSNTADDKSFGPFDIKVNQELPFSGFYVPSNPTDTNFSDTVRATGDNVVKGFPGVTAKPVTASCKGIASNPSLVLQKQCVVSTEASGPYQKVIVYFSGGVTNNGDTALVNVVVTETSSGGTATFGPYSLAPGESANFSGTYYPASPTASTQSDTVTATGESVISGFAGAVAKPVTATCAGVVSKPKLILTKKCEAAFFGIGFEKRVQVSYSGTVRNDGDTTLVEIYVTDDRGTPGVTSDDQRFGPYTLTPGQSQNFTGSYFTDNPSSASFRDVVTATANSALLGFPTVSAPATTAVCKGIVTSPAVSLTKKCAAVVADTSDPNVKVVRVVISGTIANTGDIELVEVKVLDNDGFIWDIGNLAIGQIAQFDRTITSTNPMASSYTDTVTASGKAILGFGPADFTPVTAVCNGITNTPKVDVTKTCRTYTEATTDGLQRVIVGYDGNVTNTGDVRLINVLVTDDLGTPANTADDRTFGPFNLAPGEFATFSGTYYPMSATAVTQSDTVRAIGSNVVSGFPGASDYETAVCAGIKTKPGLKLTKQCVTSLIDDTAVGRKRVLVTYNGTVINTGDVALVNVRVTDDEGTPANTADDRTFGPFNLGPGESRPFTGTYVPTPASSFSDVVTASGSSVIQGFPGATASAVTATCAPPDLRPSLVLQKQCFTKFVGTGLDRKVVVGYDITVTNNGTVNLVDVTVRDDKGTASTTDDVVYDKFTLSVSESKIFSGEYNPTNPTAAIQSDTATASATNQVIGYPGVTASPVTANCKGVTATPDLKLTKTCEVIRVPTGNYEVVHVITTGTVKNSGTIELTDVVVTDSDGTIWRFPYLAVGQIETFSKDDVPTNPTASSYNDTVTATGTAVLGFGKATAVPVTAVCKGITVNPDLVLEKSCNVVVEENAPQQSRIKVLYSGTVRNRGDVKLLNVFVVDNLGTTSTSDDVSFGPFNLAPGESKPFNGTYYPSNPTAEFFQDTVRANGESIIRGFPGAIAKPVTARCSGIKTNPALTINKECEVVIVKDGEDTKKLQVTYRGSVRNSGDVTLFNVVITDDLGTSNTADDVTYGPYTLSVGAVQTFGGQYDPAIVNADTFSDTVKASGISSISGFPAPAPVQATATCVSIKTHPKLTLSKTCESKLVYLADGSRIVKVTYSGTVRNTGDVRLINVYVTDDKGTPSFVGDDVTFGPFKLNPGENATFTGDYVPGNPSSQKFNDTVKAFGQSEIRGFPGATAMPVTAICEGVTVRPNLLVSQFCVSALEDFSGRKRLALTLNGTVSNTGDIELENVVITLESGVTIVVGNLAIGQVYTFTRVVYPTDPTQDTFPFFFTARGDAILGFGSTTSLKAEAICKGISLNPRLQLTKECKVGLEDKGASKKVVVYFKGTITNVGDIDLINVYITDNRGTPANAADDLRFGPFTLAAGASANFSGQYYPGSPTDASFSDVVTATADNIVIGYPGTTAAPVTATCIGITLTPSLALTKSCEAALRGSSDRKVVYIKFSGTVTNDGEVTLTNVMVYDDYQNTPADLTDDFTYGPFTLAVGESNSFSGEYSPAVVNAPFFTDTVRATANNVIEGFPSVSATAVEAKCKGFVFNPKIALTKECTVTVEEIEVKESDCLSVLQVNYRGTVSNVGDIGLVNVIVRDDKGTSVLSDDEFFGPFNIPVGENKSFSGSYFPCVEGISRNIELSDTVTATGKNEVVGFADPDPKSTTATCPVCY